MKACIIDDGADVLLYEWAINNGFMFHSTEQFRIYREEGSHHLSYEKDKWLQSRGYERLFESCYLPAHVKEPLRSDLVHALFSEVGGMEYSESIIPSMNIGCYDVLYHGATGRLEGNELTVLDVGCGTGVIVDSSVRKLATSLVGFDFVDANRSIAISRGLNVVDKAQLMTLPLNSVDILLCCFVLHYQSLSKDDVAILVRLLRQGGIWAANFHKSKGLTWFLHLLQMHGEFMIEQESSTYGLLLFARKVG